METKTSWVYQSFPDLAYLTVNPALSIIFGHSDIIELTVLVPPVAGALPDYAVSVPNGAPYHLADAAELTTLGCGPLVIAQAKNGLCWMSSICMSPSDPFQLNQNYYSVIYLIPDAGYAFGDSVPMTINGSSSLVNDTASRPIARTGVSLVTTTFSVSSPPTDPCAGFTDINRKAWYHDAVDYALLNGLMNGVDTTLFAPNGALSRAMLATILWRTAGSPDVNFALTFSDVPAGTWYTEAVRYASSQGIVKGYGDGRFGSTDNITREQLSAMLYRYEQTVNGGGFSGDWAFNLSFSDADKVSGWAAEGVTWCVMNGVGGGRVDGTLDPLGTATRTETAQMLMKYLTL